jgi:hypothetical protein
VRPQEIVLFLTVVAGYWTMLFKSAVLRGDTCTEYLQAIYKDTIAIWNFNDPHQVHSLLVHRLPKLITSVACVVLST